MQAQRRSSEERQAELTDAALHIIATRGIAELNTRSLAEEVGLSSGAIFRHFATLDALLEAVVERVQSVLESTYPPSELPARARLEQFVEARSAAVGKQVGILRLVLSEQFLLALPKSASKRLSVCIKKSRSFVMCCLQEGQAAGQFRSDIEAGALAVVVMGTIQMLGLSTSKSWPSSIKAPCVREGLMALLENPVAQNTKNRKRTA